MLSNAVLIAALLTPMAEPSLPRGTGLLPMSPEARAEFYRGGVAFAEYTKGMKDVPPSKCELKWAPRPHPIGQGCRGTCAGWACAYAARSVLQAQESERYPDNPDQFFSPSFVFSQRLTRADDGMGLDDAARVLIAYGCLPYSAMSYCEATVDLPPTASQLSAAVRYRVAAYVAVEPIVARLKLLLSYDHPVVIGAVATREFTRWRGDGVFSDKDYDPEHRPGGHAMCLIGYDDERKAFRLVNSWGRDWGDNGYGWVSYDLFPNQEESSDNRKPRKLPFCLDAMALIPAPVVDFKTTMTRQANDRYGWSVSVAGTPQGLDRLLAVQYLLPAGHEPATVLKPAKIRDHTDPAEYGLQSTELQSASGSPTIEIWARLVVKPPRGVKEPVVTRPRPILLSQRPSPDSEEARPADQPSAPRTSPQPRTEGTQSSRAERPSDLAEAVAVPNVVGLDTGIASVRLMSAGFQVSVRHASDRAAADRPNQVLEQSPKAGESAVKGSRVLLTVP